jgi:hypothetical protein
VSDISFFHIASVYPKATHFAISRVRTFHPNSYYFIAADAVDGYEYLSEEYKTDYRRYSKKLGGPVGDYGYRLDNVLEFLDRFRTACSRCNTSHIMMMEDDVYLNEKITVNKDWEVSCHNIEPWGNKLPEQLMEKIKIYSDCRPKIGNYCAGGGSIFKVSTFLENYDIIVEWFKRNFEEVQSYYPTIGYIDCFMNVFYYLCGKDYTINPHLIDTHNHKPGFDYELFISTLPDTIQIVNNYKKYYYE